MIITEGYKQERHLKIELFRPEATGNAASICLNDSRLIAIISDTSLSRELLVFGSADVDAVATFIKDCFDLNFL